MNALRRLWDRFFMPLEVHVFPEDVYRSGWQNGYWSGVLKGRGDVVAELEVILAAKGRSLNDLEPAELTLIKARTVH